MTENQENLRPKIGKSFRADLDALVYDPKTDTWTTKAPMPTARVYPAAAEINGKLYVAGGDTGASLAGSLEVYDPVTNTWSVKAPMLTARYAHVAANINGKLYTIGGDPSFGSESSESGTNEVYDPAADTWATEAPMPTPRWGMVAAVINGALYVVGGAIGPVYGVPQAISEVFIAPPTLTLTLTGCTTCRASDQFTVQAHVTNPDFRDVPVEAKVGVRLPDGTPINLLGNKHLEVPLPAGFDTTFTLFDFPLPDGLPMGTWSLEGTLLGPELGETFSRDVKAFNVVP